MKYTKDIINDKLEKCGKKHIVALSEVDKTTDKVHLYCTIHNIDYYQTLYDATHKKYGCSECVKQGKNNTLLAKHNLLKDRPDIADLLLDKSKASRIHTYEKHKEMFVCPNCGAKLYKQVSNVVHNGLKCDKCSDGFYYPNKLMYNILESLNVDFISEYSPEWISPKRYDFYFKIDDQSYIVEMDGGLGHGKRTFGNRTDVSISKMIDEYKDEQAILHDHIIIRIDADKSKLEYLKSNIEHSMLNDIFDLQTVDWLECDKRAQASILFDVCKYYKETTCSRQQLVNKFKLHICTIQKYLNNGFYLGIIEKYKPHLNTKKVLCIESQIVFESSSEAARYYNLDDSAISKVYLGKRKTTGGLHFKYIDECNICVDDLHPDYSIKSTKRKKEAIPVVVIDTLTNTQNEFESIGQAAKFLGKHDAIIGRALHDGKLYLGRYIINKVR